MPSKHTSSDLHKAGAVLSLYKRLGETPRERLERLRQQKPYLEHEVLSYAGRLDPMAEGVLLCLVGSANRRREQYLDLGKEYVLDVLFGFETDTYDILGRVMETGDSDEISRKAIKTALNEFRGELSQQYPPYSSKTIEGKPLFEWARIMSKSQESQGVLSSMVLPSRTVTIYDIKLVDMYKVAEASLLEYIEESVALVNGDFRQEEVTRLWKRHLKKDGTREFPAARVRIACSSGTYARSIAHELGNLLEVPTLALHLTRTQVGEYSLEKALR